MKSVSPVNQQVIANRLSISRTTVSRCFTNHLGISPKTRSKVFALAAKLGYQYLQPRSPIKNHAVKPRSIGVLICSDVEEFNHVDYESPVTELLPGISEFAQLHNWQIDIHFTSPLAASISDPSYTKLNPLKKRLWAGLLLVYPFSPRIIEELTVRFSCVSLVEQYGRVSVDCVDVDHSKGRLVVDRPASSIRTFPHRIFSLAATPSKPRGPIAVSAPTWKNWPVSACPTTAAT